MIKYESFKNSTSPQIQFILGSKNDKCLSKKTNAGEQQIFYFSPLLLSLAEFGTPKYIKYIEFRAEFFCGILITMNQTTVVQFFKVFPDHFCHFELWDHGNNIRFFLSHSRAHTHWNGQQDLQSKTGRASKKSSRVVGMGGMACLNRYVV